MARVACIEQEKDRETMKVGTMTPWGAADHVEKLAEGIWWVSTPGHGGIGLSPARALHMPVGFETASTDGAGRWYEEDCAWALVAITFPEAFPQEERHTEPPVEYAKGLAVRYFPELAVEIAEVLA